MKTQTILMTIIHFTIIPLSLSSESKLTPSIYPEYPKHIIPNTFDTPKQTYSPFLFKGGLANIPKLQNTQTAGEGALFYSSNVLAVADGVRESDLQGFDALEYSRKLVENARDFFQNDPGHYSQYPKDLLVKCVKNNYEMGDSTLVLLTLWNKFLKVGFSGKPNYMILTPVLKKLPLYRKYNIIWEAQEINKQQENAFNFPFEMEMNKDDPVHKTKAFVHEVSYGSLVIVMSNGVMDNFFPHDVEFVVNEYIKTIKKKHGRGLHHVVKNFDGQYFSEYLVKRIHAISGKNEFVSPLVVNAMRSGLIVKRGKVDDISVVAAMIRYANGVEKIGDLLWFFVIMVFFFSSQ
jgi:hypothetical protein